MNTSNLPELPKKCETCGYISGHFMRQIFANGSENLVFVCRLCKRHMSKSRAFWPKAIYWGRWEDLPVFHNAQAGGCPCWVQGCGNTDTELHHFAPKEFWGKDAEAWPMAYLCRYHHRMWHDVMSGAKLYSGDCVLEERRARFVTTGGQQ